jgi:hypothetical protein
MKLIRTRHSDIVHPVSSSQLARTRDRTLVRVLNTYNVEAQIGGKLAQLGSEWSTAPPRSSPPVPRKFAASVGYGLNCVLALDRMAGGVQSWSLNPTNWA